MRDQLKMAILRKFRFQVDFAQEAGVDEGRISKIIRGRENPTPEQKKEMAAALDISLDQLEELLRHEIPQDTRPR